MFQKVGQLFHCHTMLVALFAHKQCGIKMSRLGLIEMPFIQEWISEVLPLDVTATLQQNLYASTGEIHRLDEGQLYYSGYKWAF